MDEVIVLVPGLWMPSSMFSVQRRRLEKIMPTYGFSYPSVRHDLSTNTQRLADFCGKLTAEKIHLVGHSLGGVLIMAMLRDFPEIPTGKIILLGAPVMGSHVANQLGRYRVLRTALGLSICQWLGQKNQDGCCCKEIGIIAGSKSIGLGRCLVRIARPNDGVITVAETQIPSAKDSIILNVSHSGMLFSRDVTQQVSAFVHTGAFLQP